MRTSTAPFLTSPPKSPPRLSARWEEPSRSGRPGPICEPRPASRKARGPAPSHKARRSRARADAAPDRNLGPPYRIRPRPYSQSPLITRLPVVFAFSHIMRYSGRHMDSIDGTSWKSKGVVASGVGVLDKAVAILSLLSEDGPASLAGVVEGTGLPRPTAHRLLSALEAHHLVARAGGRYSLGSRLLGWGNKAVGIGVVEAARPALAALRDKTGESTQLYVREGDRRVCILSVERATGLKTTVAL